MCWDHVTICSPNFIIHFITKPKREAITYVLQLRGLLVVSSAVLKLLCLNFVILQRKAEIDQLMDGLNDLGFLDFYKKHLLHLAHCLPLAVSAS